MKDKLEFNEENQINLVVGKDGLKREMFYQGKPIQELIKYKDMWQKLKEILKRQIDIDNKEYLESGFPIFKNYVAVENFILQKMQELEAEDVED